MADLDLQREEKISVSGNRTRNLLMFGTEPRHFTDLKLLKESLKVYQPLYKAQHVMLSDVLYQIA